MDKSVEAKITIAGPFEFHFFATPSCGQIESLAVNILWVFFRVSWVLLGSKRL